MLSELLTIAIETIQRDHTVNYIDPTGSPRRIEIDPGILLDVGTGGKITIPEGVMKPIEYVVRENGILLLCSPVPGTAEYQYISRRLEDLKIIYLALPYGPYLNLNVVIGGMWDFSDTRSIPKINEEGRYIHRETGELTKPCRM